MCSGIMTGCQTRTEITARARSERYQHLFMSALFLHVDFMCMCVFDCACVRVPKSEQNLNEISKNLPLGTSSFVKLV